MITIWIIPIALIVNPVKAYSETIFSGGGIITEGCDENAPIIKLVVFAIGEGALGGDGDGRLKINFENTRYSYLGDDHFDNGEFIATHFSRYEVETRQVEYPKNSGVLHDYTFVRIVANGQFNGEDGWSTHLRFSDSGHPCDAESYACRSEKRSTGKKIPYRIFTATDSVRIQIYDEPDMPGDDLAYDTASGPIPEGEDEMVYDFPHEQSWRTFFDAGNISLYNLD